MNRRWPAWRPILLGFAVAAALTGGVGLWLAQAQIAGAVIAPAELRVESRRKTVSHLEGGVVAEIFVRDGDQVTAGQPLIRLETVETTASLATTDAEIDAALARQARFRAERDGAVAIAADAALFRRTRDRSAAAEALAGQQRLFDARRDTLARQRAQLRARIEQYADEIAGAEAQRSALDAQLGLLEEELTDQQALLDRGLTQKSRVTALRRERARLNGDRGARRAEIARTRGRIAETELRLLELEAERREDAIAELRDLETRLSELAERRAALSERLRRAEIRAPRSGVVLDMAVHTVGGVISPAEALLQIVPANERLIVEARIDALARDRVRAGQSAVIRFPGFNQRTTPEIDGSVAQVAGDALRDAATGAAYYPAEIAVAPAEFERLRAALGADLAPGMPAEVYVTTERRSAGSWLLKPLLDNFHRALREE